MGNVFRLDHHKIANEILPLKRLKRGGDLAEWRGRSKKRSDLAGLDIADQTGLHRLLLSGGADERDVLQIHFTDVEIDSRHGDGTGGCLALATEE